MTASLRFATYAPDPRRTTIGIQPLSNEQPPVDIDFRPRTVNLRNIYEGDTTPIDLVLTSRLTGEPVDVSSAEPRAQIRPTPDSETVIAELDASIDPQRTNVIRLLLPATENIDKPERAVWDCQLTIGEHIITVAAGEVEWTQEVTRP